MCEYNNYRAEGALRSSGKSHTGPRKKCSTCEWSTYAVWEPVRPAFTPYRLLRIFFSYDHTLKSTEKKLGRVAAREVVHPDANLHSFLIPHLICGIGGKSRILFGIGSQSRIFSVILISITSSQTHFRVVFLGIYSISDTQKIRK